ncbi:MAG: hypothetical protein CSA50_09325, partial [Gammaproteobacteria bacterium]
MTRSKHAAYGRWIFGFILLVKLNSAAGIALFVMLLAWWQTSSAAVQTADQVASTSDLASTLPAASPAIAPPESTTSAALFIAILQQAEVPIEDWDKKLL